MLHRSIPSMVLQARLKQSLAVQVRKGNQHLRELANMLALVPRHRLALVQQNSPAHQNNALTVYVAVIGCKKFQSLSGNFSPHLLLAKGDTMLIFCKFVLLSYALCSGNSCSPLFEGCAITVHKVGLVVLAECPSSCISQWK